MENGIKYFDEWAKLKKELHNSENRLVFHEREIWWYAAGENIGIEINGKNEKFVRPVLILRKYGDFGFFGIPLSSNLRENLRSITFEYKHKNSALYFPKLELIVRIGCIGKLVEYLKVILR